MAVGRSERVARVGWSLLETKKTRNIKNLRQFPQVLMRSMIGAQALATCAAKG